MEAYTLYVVYPRRTIITSGPAFLVGGMGFPWESWEDPLKPPETPGFKWVIGTKGGTHGTHAGDVSHVVTMDFNYRSTMLSHWDCIKFAWELKVANQNNCLFFTKKT